MKKTEWLKMMEQDLETMIADKKVCCNAVFMGAKEVLSQYPDDTEIDHELTVEKIYKNMEDHARKNKTGGFYCFTPQGALEFIREQLGLEKIEASNQPNPALAPAAPQNDIIGLEDFF